MAEPNWYPDPLRWHVWRYWDGTAWTEQVSDANQTVSEDPLARGPRPPADATSAWLADPLGRQAMRYWDGAVWTDHVANGGPPSIDAVSQGPLPPSADQPIGGVDDLTRLARRGQDEVRKIASRLRDSFTAPRNDPSSRSPEPPIQPRADPKPPASQTAAWTPNVNVVAARRLVLDLIHQTHANRPLENDEALQLFSRFQEAGGVPTDPYQMTSFIRNGDPNTYRERPWLWLTANARRAAQDGDDEFVAYAVFWAGVWHKQFYQRFSPLLSRAFLLVGNVPLNVRNELKQLAAASVPRLPRDRVLFGDDTGQVTVGWLADMTDTLLA